MDNDTSINTLADSADVIAGAAKLIATAGKKLSSYDGARGHSLAYLSAIHVASGNLVAPKGEANKDLVSILHPNVETMFPVYSTSVSGLVGCTFVDSDGKAIPVKAIDVIKVTSRQLYDACKVSVANGLTANEIKAFEGNKLKLVMPQHIADIVSKTSRKIGSRFGDYRGGLETREGEQIMDDLQAAEKIAAAKEDRKETNLRKKAQQESHRTGIERLLSGMADLTRIASNDPKPDLYKVTPYKEWIQTGYAFLNAPIPIEKAGDEK